MLAFSLQNKNILYVVFVTLHMISGTKVITRSQHASTQKQKEIDFNTLTRHARAHFNEPVLLSHITH